MSIFDAKNEENKIEIFMFYFKQLYGTGNFPNNQ